MLLPSSLKVVPTRYEATWALLTRPVTVGYPWTSSYTILSFRRLQHLDQDDFHRPLPQQPCHGVFLPSSPGETTEDHRGRIVLHVQQHTFARFSLWKSGQAAMDAPLQSDEEPTTDPPEEEQDLLQSHSPGHCCPSLAAGLSDRTDGTGTRDDSHSSYIRSDDGQWAGIN